MKFLSVCSGIEAASSAWAPLGWEAVAFSEIEPFPCAVLAHHYPDVPNYGDMTKLPARIASGEVVAPDVFCGGTPCQAFSVAGLRLSLDDARGNLSLTFCEIANAIDTVRAGRGDPEAIVFWENVPGVLSTADNAFGCFLAGLAGDDQPMVPEPRPATGKSSRYWKWSKKSGGHSLSWPIAGCVFGPSRAVAWRVLDAQYFGVAQRRRRVFVVASARTGFDPAAVLFEFDGVRRDSAPSREARQDAAAGTLRSTDGGSDVDHAMAGHIHPVAFGENRTSGPIKITPALLAQPGSGWKGDFEIETFLVQPTAHTLRGDGFDASEDGTGSGTPLVPVLPFDTTQITSAANYSNPRQGDPCHPLDAGAHAPAIAFDCKSSGQNGFGVAVEVAGTQRAMEHSGSHSNGGGHQAVAYTTKLHNTGSNNAGKLFEERSPCLDACSPAPALLTAMQVRRLTPRECERLQGFPDDYTLIPWTEYKRIAKAAEKAGVSFESELKKRGKVLRTTVDDCPDGPRYKALGNSWAVPVARWIGERIEAVESINALRAAA